MPSAPCCVLPYVTPFSLFMMYSVCVIFPFPFQGIRADSKAVLSGETHRIVCLYSCAQHLLQSDRRHRLAYTMLFSYLATLFAVLAVPSWGEAPVAARRRRVEMRIA